MSRNTSFITQGRRYGGSLLLVDSELGSSVLKMQGFFVGVEGVAFLLLGVFVRTAVRKLIKRTRRYSVQKGSHHAKDHSTDSRTTTGPVYTRRDPRSSRWARRYAVRPRGTLHGPGAGGGLSRGRMTDTQNVNCIACGNEIPVDAHLCSRCHSYQTAWKNHIRYFSTIIGLIAAIIAALTYVVPPLWKEMTWLDKIQLLSLRAPGAISVANVGVGDLFMLTFKWSGEIEGNESLEVFQINRKLAVAQLIEAVPLERKDLNKVKLARYLTIDEVPKGSRAGVVNKALSIEDKCYDLRIFTKEHMEMMIRQSKSLWVVPLNGSLSFYSIHSRKTLEEKFTVFGFVMKGNDSKCSP